MRIYVFNLTHSGYAYVTGAAAFPKLPRLSLSHMHSNSAAFTTDQQRLSRPSQSHRPLSVPPVGDKVRLNRVASTKPVPKPVVVAQNTFVIRGKDDTFLSLDFGFGRLAQQLNLYDYLPAHRVPHLSNHTVDLTGYLPDAIGLDIGLAAGLDLHTPLLSAGLSGVGGVNLLWHTRGDAQARWPEVHVYYGHSANLSRGSVLDSLSSMVSPVNLSGAVQLILAWATFHDDKGEGYPAPSAWVANGYNWTGKFYSVGLSIPVYGAFSLVGSYYQSTPLFSDLKNTKMWRGISIGVGVSAKVVKVTGLTSKTGIKETGWKIKPDIANIFKNFGWHKFKSLGLGQAVTNYGLLYGNGGDYIPAAKKTGRPQRSITGWHLEDFPGINQDHDQ